MTHNNWLDNKNQESVLVALAQEFSDHVIQEFISGSAIAPDLMTANVIQGSTFESGGIDGDDLFSRLLIKEKDKSQSQETLKEYHRLWYVAASRFQKRILFTTPNKNKVKALM